MSQPTLALPPPNAACTLQGPPPTRSRSLFKRVATKLAAAKPSPATNVTKDAREDALRARGLLPPKDLSWQEAERDALLATPVMSPPDSPTCETREGEMSAAQKILDEWRQRTVASSQATTSADGPFPKPTETIPEEEDDDEERVPPRTAASDEVTPSSHAEPEEASTLPTEKEKANSSLPTTDSSPSPSAPAHELTTEPTQSRSTGPETASRRPPPPPPILISTTPATDDLLHPSAPHSPPLPSPRLVPLPPSPSLSPSPRLQVPSPPALRTRSDTVGTSTSEIPSLLSADGSAETDLSPSTPLSTEPLPPLRSVPEASEVPTDTSPLPGVRTRTLSAPQRKPSLFNALKRGLTTARPTRRRASPSPSRPPARSTSTPPTEQLTSPPRSPVVATSAMGKRRSSTLDSVSERPRMAVQPQIYSMGAISHQAGEIEDEESRRLSEMAFLDW